MLTAHDVAFLANRYPYRHLLNAGYRVFMPCYRGTLGYGDEWAQGNIFKQVCGCSIVKKRYG